jgi:hypothetical protein
MNDERGQGGRDNHRKVHTSVHTVKGSIQAGEKYFTEENEEGISE